MKRLEEMFYAPHAQNITSKRFKWRPPNMNWWQPMQLIDYQPTPARLGLPLGSRQSVVFRDGFEEFSTWLANLCRRPAFPCTAGRTQHRSRWNRYSLTGLGHQPALAQRLENEKREQGTDPIERDGEHKDRIPVAAATRDHAADGHQ